MEYKLAKELKDGGYPQEAAKGSFLSGTWFEREKTYIPTLEELIDACGDEFRLLELVSGKRWECVGVDEFFDTPKEAVAKLYIQLNEKR